MSEAILNVDDIPTAHRVAFRGFARALRERTGDRLLGLSATGGWLVGDPLFNHTPALSVAVLSEVDLRLLDALAHEGVKFGKQHIAAPLIMTPDYIQASCDTYPLELLEIQQLHALVCGKDHFASLNFERRDIRLQCERELKAELIQLRQGLLRAAGNHKLLGQVCRGCTESGVRVLRGLMHIEGNGEVQQFAANLVSRAADVTGVKLDGLRRVVDGDGQGGFANFERFYREVEALAAHVDQLPEA